MMWRRGDASEKKLITKNVTKKKMEGGFFNPPGMTIAPGEK
jgi:hypothetical protein